MICDATWRWTRASGSLENAPCPTSLTDACDCTRPDAHDRCDRVRPLRDDNSNLVGEMKWAVRYLVSWSGERMSRTMLACGCGFLQERQTVPYLNTLGLFSAHAAGSLLRGALCDGV